MHHEDEEKGKHAVDMDNVRLSDLSLSANSSSNTESNGINTGRDTFSVRLKRNTVLFIQKSQLDEDNIEDLQNKSIYTKINISIWFSLAYMFATEIVFITTVFFNGFSLFLTLATYGMIAFYNITNLYADFNDLYKIFSFKHSRIVKAVIFLLIAVYLGSFSTSLPPIVILYAGIGRFCLTYSSIICFAYKIRHIMRLMEEFKDSKLHRIPIENFTAVHTMEARTEAAMKFKGKIDRFTKLSKNYLIELYTSVILVIATVLVVFTEFESIISNVNSLVYVIFTIVSLFVVLVAAVAQITYFNYNVERAHQDFKVRSKLTVKFLGVVPVSYAALFSMMFSVFIISIKLFFGLG